MTDMPEWVRSYVGLPFKDKGRGPDGFDCWGVVSDVLCRQFGIWGLPDYSDRYLSCADAASVSELVRAEQQTGQWLRVEAASTGAVVMFRLLGRPWHCGLMLTPHLMLHALEGVGVVIEDVRGITWRNRVEGFYEYVR